MQLPGFFHHPSTCAKPALAAALGAGLCGPLAHAATVSWTPAQAVESRSESAASPRLAMDAQGNAMALWVQSDGTASSIYAARYVAGTGWRSPELIETSAMPADSPQVAVDAQGNFIAVWRQAWKVANGALYGIDANRYVAGTGWGTPATVYVDTSRSDVTANADVQLAMDPQGNAMAVWSVYDWSWNHNSVRAARYGVGSGWGSAANLSTESVQSASGGSVAMDDNGNALVLWTQDRGTSNSTQGVMAVRHAAGGGWGTPARIEDATAAAARPGWGPRVAFDASGNALAVWYQYSRPGIYSNRYSASGGWGTPLAIADAGSSISYDEGVTLAMDKRSGNAMALWNQYGGVLWANRYTSGSGWGATAIVDRNGSNYSQQAAYDGNGQALAVWANYSCNAYNLPFAQHTAAAGWSLVPRCYESPLYVNSTRDYASEPQLAVDGAGNAMVLWLQSGSIWSARYSAPLDPADCLFAWAERTYPSYFAPSGGSSSTALDYRYRYYSGTNAYLATAARDGHLYYYGTLSGQTLLDLGMAATWLGTAGCR